MKHIFLYTSAIVLGTMTYSSISALSPVACTMEYAPVCGSVQVQCITIPCDPVRQTFSNTCMANAEGATNITTGECSNPGTITPPVIVGGDRDKYGCIGSAGYRWNSLLGECVRPWMTKTKVLTIGPDMTTCYGMVPYACMQIRQGHKVFPFYERVEGFDYATGSLYRLLVRVEKLENPPADASDTRYTFIKLLSKTSVIPQNPSTASGSFSRTQSLSGTSWTIESMNGVLIQSPGTLQFRGDVLSAKFCNIISGTYRAEGNILRTSGLMSTMMYCEGELMNVEGLFDIEGATYAISSDRLTLTTRRGTVMVWKKQ